MKTILARYPGHCVRTGQPFKAGELIGMLGKGRYILIEQSEPVDPDLSLASSIDPELAESDPDAAAHAGRYLRESMSRGVSDIWLSSSGREFYRNRRGLCEDAPCCGCCNA